MIDKTKILVGDNREVMVVQKEKNVCDKEMTINRILNNDKEPSYVIEVCDNDVYTDERIMLIMSQKDMKEFLYKVGKLVEID